LLDAVAEIYKALAESEAGGRFLIKTDGAYFWKCKLQVWAKFAEFSGTLVSLRGNLTPQIEPTEITLQELGELMKPR
jgi:hypothetical protein